MALMLAMPAMFAMLFMVRGYVQTAVCGRNSWCIAAQVARTTRDADSVGTWRATLCGSLGADVRDDGGIVRGARVR